MFENDYFDIKIGWSKKVVGQLELIEDLLTSGRTIEALGAIRDAIRIHAYDAGEMTKCQRITRDELNNYRPESPKPKTVLRGAATLEKPNEG